MIQSKFPLAAKNDVLLHASQYQGYHLWSGGLVGVDVKKKVDYQVIVKQVVGACYYNGQV